MKTSAFRSAVLVVLMLSFGACTDDGEPSVAPVLDALEGAAPDQMILGEGDLVRDQTRRIESVELVDDTALVVRVIDSPKGDVYTDPCAGKVELQVVETGDDVTLTAWAMKPEIAPQLPDNWGCNSVGFEHVLNVTLKAPLADRRVIDSHSGDAASIADHSSALTPGWLPDGYVEKYQASNEGVLEFAYGLDDGDFPAIRYTVAQLDDRWNDLESYRSREAATVKERTIRDFEGLLVTSLEDGSHTFVFDDGERLHAVTAQAPVSLEDAMRFVEEMIDQ